MSDANTNSRHCRLAAGILAGLLLLAGLLVIWPWMTQNRAYDKEIADKTEQLARFRSSVAQRPALEAKLQQIGQAADRSRYYIPASTPAVAAAELQKQAKRIIDTRRGKLMSTQALTAQEDNKTVRIAIRVHMRIGPENLANVLHALESGRPLLFVENLSIRAPIVRRRSKRVARTNRDLNVYYDLAGYMRRTTQ